MENAAPPWKRRWFVFAAIALPLGTLLVLQYVALAKLEETSAIATRMNVMWYAKSILHGVEGFYRQKATTLDVPPALLTAEAPAALETHFASGCGLGVRGFFVIRFAEDGGQRLRLYGRDGRELRTAPDPAEVQAIQVASAPWRLIARERTPVESSRTIVDEQDPANRVILKPVLDGSSHVLGVAGLLVDEEFVRGRYLPKLIDAQRADLRLPRPLREQLVLAIRDDQARVVAGSSDSILPGADFTMRFPFVFTDWTLGVGSHRMTPEEWAHFTFGISLSLSLLLTAVLVGGLVLALRNAARASKLSQMKTEFVSNVSHELRTPLASIRVFGEFLRLGRATAEKVREYGEYIEAESRRLSRLVDNILDFSRIESGRKRYRLEIADLREIVRDTVKAFEVRLRQEGVSVNVRAPDGPLPTVRVDAEAIAQALANLLDNAVKYSGGAHPVAVELGQRNGSLTLAVRDRGPGISPEDQERIFEKFYRVSTGLVHDVKGSGLGLAIVKHVVEAHEGTVVVDSRPGAGSTFTIELPVHAA
jgi:signal transduction histidine kinase